MTIRKDSKSARHILTAFVGTALLFTSACDQTPDDPFAAAVEASEAGDYQTARIMIRQALEADPNNVQAIMLYGKTQLALDNPDGAATEFQRILNDPELGTEASALLAKSYLQRGNTRLAQETLEKHGMESGLAMAVAVVVELNEGNADKALSLLEDGLARFPDSLDLKVLDAKRAYDGRDLDRSRKLLQDILAKEPNRIEALLIAGRLEQSARNFDAAKAHFEKVQESNPWNMPSILSLAAIAREEGDNEQASQWLAKAKEVSPNHPVSAYFAAQIAYEEGDVEQAHSILQATPGDAGDFPAMLMLKGLVSAERGQTQTSISELEHFFRSGGDNDAARAVLAQQYASTGADQKAWDILQPSLRSANASAATLQLGANLASKLGNVNEEAELGRRAKKAATTASYSQSLADAGQHIRTGNWKEADKAYQNALNKGGDTDPVVLNNAASIRMELGDAEGAISLARKAIALAPDDPLIMDTLGWALVQGDPDNAEGRALIERAVSLAPGNKEIVDHWVAINN